VGLTKGEARAQLIALDRFEADTSLRNFVPLAWPILEPEAQYVGGWAIDAMCEHLEAVTYGWINRLLINVPPGSMKSLLSSVMWPAWEWGPRDRPALRYISTAFNDGPVKRDTRKMRDLVASQWYQERWPGVRLVRSGETSFSNSRTGNREGVPFGSLTSQRGDRLIIDDPHSTKTAESKAEREATVRQFREGATNRLNNQEKSAIIVIMQRLHEGDISGEALALDMGYVHLNLPMQFEPDRRCTTRIGFKDPRTHEGELLNPGRFSAKTVAQLQNDLGDYAYAGQYQQRPVPREGGLFKREWFEGKIVRVAPAGTVWVRHYDLAATKDAGAWTAGVKMGRTPDGKFVVAHVDRLRETGDVVRKRIKAVNETDRMEDPNCLLSLPQDGGQAGKVQKADFATYLAGVRLAFLLESSIGDKETRADPFSVQCEAGNVTLVGGPDLDAKWIPIYLDELCMFPGGKYKDQVDASSGAFAQLTLGPQQQQLVGRYGGS
jgi:predicted phage terminase large subunit-like protein